MQPMTIRRATAQDAAHLSSMVQGSGAYRGMYAPMVAGYQVTPEYIRRHEVFAAVDGARLLGFYALILHPAELDLAFVADEAQGVGIGRLLLDHMLDQARAAGLTEVRVVSHPPAERFYRRMGAERVGTAPPAPPKVTWERPELRFALT
ncbi:GNAT family N-acetyltransferase [Streptomyces thermolilacinus]|uniref:GNAT family N-acetyltransferase n=1 Tax=Streptomyces thermolilacinus SPC6 TaxID=1306406 RepID=A0A1D3DMK9_9ACTN|nr:GNAT family N-acetyltransferase [Streptomyces thermolilacinus]OEJ93565.1 GNAT family N-acetyltransferase [Streptomyces thermolilacinus SPC6]